MRNFVQLLMETLRVSEIRFSSSSLDLFID